MAAKTKTLLQRKEPCHKGEFWPHTHTHTSAHMHPHTDTVKSFVEMARYLLDQPGVKFLLSERFCQDPLESFFGHQRSKGGHNDNPTVKQFCDNTVSLRVQGAAALNPLRGNCRKRPTEQVIPIDETPLPKRKRYTCT